MLHENSEKVDGGRAIIAASAGDGALDSPASRSAKGAAMSDGQRMIGISSWACGSLRAVRKTADRSAHRGQSISPWRSSFWGPANSALIPSPKKTVHVRRYGPQGRPPRCARGSQDPSSSPRDYVVALRQAQSKQAKPIRLSGRRSGIPVTRYSGIPKPAVRGPLRAPAGR